MDRKQYGLILVLVVLAGLIGFSGVYAQADSSKVWIVTLKNGKTVSGILESLYQDKIKIKVDVGIVEINQEEIANIRPYFSTPKGLLGLNFLFGSNVGGQAETRISRKIGMRLRIIYATGYDDPAEYSYACVGTVNYHLPIKNEMFDPIIGGGLVYSSRHWHNTNGFGDISDLTFCSTFGVGLNVSSTLQMEIDCLVTSTYFFDTYAEGKAEKTRRILYVYPVFGLNLLF